jgi:topoisomerase-4 subunit B
MPLPEPTTHDWSRDHDPEHLRLIRENPDRYAPTGMCHLILEVLAYAADEAEDLGAGRAVVEFHPDGSVSVSDDGRGTQMAIGDDGRPVRKPVMATTDFRYFDSPPATPLPDGHPRYGMSVVAALSEWLVHTNRRAEGAWTQRYHHGVPADDLVAVAADGTTGTTVRFLPAVGLKNDPSAESLRPLAERLGGVLVVEV